MSERMKKMFANAMLEFWFHVNGSKNNWLEEKWQAAY